MRILQVAKFYHPYSGGMETVVRSLCDGLHALGHEVTCLVANTDRQMRREVVGGVRVVRVPSFGRLRSVSICPGFMPAFRQTAAAADVIHVHQQNPLADLAVLLARPRVPVIVTCHSDIVRQRLGRLLWRPLLEQVWKLAERVIVASPPMARALAGDGSSGARMAVIPYGIKLPVNGGPQAAESIGDEKPLLLAVGRLVSYKGFESLIAALAHVPNARLVIVGDGPLRQRLEEVATRCDVRSRVEFAGEVPAARLSELYRSCTVFVLPSVTAAEAFGMVQLEAMAHGKPVVSTALPTGVPWVNRHGETGLVVPPGSVDDLARAVNILLGDAPLRQRMGAAGRARVEGEFTAHRMVRRYEEVYAQAGVAMLSSPRARGACERIRAL